jgi:hypothetical protein
MKDNSHRSPEQAQNADARLTIPSVSKNLHRCGIKASIWVAFLLLLWDVAITGSFLMSFFVCPIWFLVSVLKNAIMRPGLRLTIIRFSIPALTLGVVFANNSLQQMIAEANATRIVAACEEFHTNNGRFPNTIYELVPQYLPCIPPAKYCLDYGDFVYINYGKPMLIWYVVPPFGRNTYDFETRHWNYID